MYNEGSTCLAKAEVSDLGVPGRGHKYVEALDILEAIYHYMSVYGNN